MFDHELDEKTQMKTCPFCAEQVQDAAIVCRYCGADLLKGVPGAARPAQVVIARKELSSGGAAVLSLFIPGAGQMYCGHVFEGLCWLFFVVVGYALFILPGLLLHVLCIFGALTLANRENQRQTAATAAPVKPQEPSTTASVNVGRAAGGIWAMLTHPRATMRHGTTVDRALVIVAYALGAILLLRAIWLQGT